MFPKILLKYIFCVFAFAFWGYTSFPLTIMDELCDNAIDDDNDRLIDLNNPDCDYVVIEPISLFPNPFFEDLDCCPFERNQLDCAEVWIQASEPTTDLIQPWPTLAIRKKLLELVYIMATFLKLQIE